ncbi:MAG TPA: zf-TFIIB domain-containing protein [Acidimicrobiales bacterium]
MNCPVCAVTLVISSREGIEIDHCPQCRGVWLDRGELDKIIDRAAPAVVRSTAPDAAWEGRADRGDDRYRGDRDERYRGDRDERYRGDRDDDYRGPRRKRRGSFLEDLFDFD